MPAQVFHLAIPSHDLEAAVAFYVTGLGSRLARRYESHITLDFFEAQLVCHLSEEIVTEPRMYPRHFGITFRERTAFDTVLQHAEAKALPFFQPMFHRFEGKPEAHLSFFLQDPSNNLIEFKHYLQPEMMY